MCLMEIVIGRSRGSTGMPPPQQDPIPSFLHTFSPKSARVRGRCPPSGSASPPMGQFCKLWFRFNIFFPFFCTWNPQVECNPTNKTMWPNINDRSLYLKLKFPNKTCPVNGNSLMYFNMKLKKIAH